MLYLRSMHTPAGKARAAEAPATVHATKNLVTGEVEITIIALADDRRVALRMSEEEARALGAMIADAADGRFSLWATDYTP